MKTQQEVGFEKLLSEFKNLSKEFMHEKNFSEIRTCIVGEGTRNQHTRKVYGYRLLKPDYKIKLELQSELRPISAGCLSLVSSEDEQQYISSSDNNM